MARWGAWPRGAVAAFACGAVAVLAACSAGSKPSPAPAAATSSAAQADAGRHREPVRVRRPRGAADRAGGDRGGGATAGRGGGGVRGGSGGAWFGRPGIRGDVLAGQVPGRVPVRRGGREPGDQHPANGRPGPVGAAPADRVRGRGGSFISVLDATKIVDAGYAGHASLYSSGPGGLTGPRRRRWPPRAAPTARRRRCSPTASRVSRSPRPGRPIPRPFGSTSPASRPSSGASTPGPAAGCRRRAGRGCAWPTWSSRSCRSRPCT